MESKVCILPIEEHHIEAFRAVVDSVSRERRFLGHLEAPSIEQTRAFVRGNIERGHPQFVALIAERLVGWCDVIPKSLSMKAHSGVLGIGIENGFRGRGIGETLMRTTIAAARRAGLTRIELTVRASNANAIALHRKLGFVEEGRARNAVRIDGAYEDCLSMALLFEP